MPYAMYPEKIVAVTGPGRDAKTHRLITPVRVTTDLPRKGDGFHRAPVLCGRTVKATGGWDERGWDAHMDDYRRFNGTHEHYTCARCAGMFDAMTEED